MFSIKVLRKRSLGSVAHTEARANLGVLLARAWRNRFFILRSETQCYGVALLVADCLCRQHDAVTGG